MASVRSLFVISGVVSSLVMGAQVFAGTNSFDPICTEYVGQKKFKPGDTTYWETKVVPEFERVLKSPSLESEAQLNSKMKTMMAAYGLRENEISQYNSQRLVSDCAKTPTMEGCYAMQAYCVRDFVKKELPASVMNTLGCLEPYNRPYCGKAFQTAEGIEANLNTLKAVDEKFSKVLGEARSKPLVPEYLADVDSAFVEYSARVQEALKKGLSLTKAMRDELEKTRKTYEKNKATVKNLGDAAKAFDQCREYLKSEGLNDNRYLVDQVCSANANSVTPQELSSFRNIMKDLRANENEFRRKDTFSLVKDTYDHSLRSGARQYLESYFGIKGALPEKNAYCKAIGGCNEALNGVYDEVSASRASLKRIDRVAEAASFNQAVAKLNQACADAAVSILSAGGGTANQNSIAKVNSAYSDLVNKTGFGTLMGMGKFKDSVGSFDQEDCLEAGDGMKTLSANDPNLDASLQEALNTVSDKMKELQKQKGSIVDSSNPYPGLRYFLEYEPLSLREVVRLRNDPQMASLMCLEIDKIYRKEKNSRVITGVLTGLAIAGAVAATVLSGGLASPTLVAALGMSSVAIGVGTGAAGYANAKYQETKYEQSVQTKAFDAQLGQSLVDQYYFQGNAELVGIAASFAPGAGKLLYKGASQVAVRTGLATSVELASSTLNAAVRTSPIVIQTAKLTKPAMDLIAKVNSGAKVYLSELQVALASRVGPKTMSTSVALFNGIADGMATDVAITFGVHALAHPDPYSEEGMLDLLTEIAMSRGISAIGRSGAAFLNSRRPNWKSGKIEPVLQGKSGNTGGETPAIGGRSPDQSSTGEPLPRGAVKKIDLKDPETGQPYREFDHEYRQVLWQSLPDSDPLKKTLQALDKKGVKVVEFIPGKKDGGFDGLYLGKKTISDLKKGTSGTFEVIALNSDLFKRRGSISKVLEHEIGHWNTFGKPEGKFNFTKGSAEVLEGKVFEFSGDLKEYQKFAASDEATQYLKQGMKDLRGVPETDVQSRFRESFDRPVNEVFGEDYRAGFSKSREALKNSKEFSSFEARLHSDISRQAKADLFSASSVIEKWSPGGGFEVELKRGDARIRKTLELDASRYVGAPKDQGTLDALRMESRKIMDQERQRVIDEFKKMGTTPETFENPDVVRDIEEQSRKAADRILMEKHPWLKDFNQNFSKDMEARSDRFTVAESAAEIALKKLQDAELRGKITQKDYFELRRSLTDATGALRPDGTGLTPRKGADVAWDELDLYQNGLHRISGTLEVPMLSSKEEYAELLRKQTQNETVNLSQVARPGLANVRDGRVLVLQGSGRWEKTSGDGYVDVFVPESAVLPANAITLEKGVSKEQVRTVNLLSSRGNAGTNPEFMDLKLNRMEERFKRVLIPKSEVSAPFSGPGQQLDELMNQGLQQDPAKFNGIFSSPEWKKWNTDQRLKRMREFFPE